MFTLLFVCTGNTCRSPMAEFLFKNLAGDLEDLEVLSAGVSTVEGLPASEHALSVMREKGISLDNHRTRPVSREIIEKADLVLTMTTRHKEILISRFPEFRNKVFTLKEYAGEEGDVVDPFGEGEEVYRSCRDELESLIIKIKDRIVKQIENRE